MNPSIELNHSLNAYSKPSEYWLRPIKLEAELVEGLQWPWHPLWYLLYGIIISMIVGSNKKKFQFLLLGTPTLVIVWKLMVREVVSFKFMENLDSHPIYSSLADYFQHVTFDHVFCEADMVSDFFASLGQYSQNCI